MTKLDAMNRNVKALFEALIAKGMEPKTARLLARQAVAAAEIVRELHERGLSLSDEGIAFVAEKAAEVAAVA